LGDGWTLSALARSDASGRAVRERGAEAVPGDLDDVPALRDGAQGADGACHAAAHLGEWGSRSAFERVNVGGTRNVLRAAREVGVPRFVHVGTEAALLAGRPLVMVDERAPLRPDSPALYSRTKAQAEIAVLEANGDGLATMVVRPRLVWGVGDTTILPALVDAVRHGRWAWIGGGRHLTSTTHVDNVVEGLVLAAQKGTPGGVWFVTDGEPVVFRSFVESLLRTQGLDVPQRNVPRPLATVVAAGGELAWRALPLPGQPPLTRLAAWLASQEATIDISRAREELGYAPVTTREQGLAALSAAGPRPL
jgi:nucleoside-diphosphate-sugar epimerase